MDKNTEFQMKFLYQAAHSPESQKSMETCLREDSLDYWTHLRILKYLDPVITSFPEAKWLTVGDGHFAAEARHILKINQGADVLATDLFETPLKMAKDMGLIQKYSVQDVTNLKFEDHSFDIVIAKSCIHHIPKPMLAIYEMIRVARQAVILIEPCEQAWLPGVDSNNLSFRDFVRSWLKQSGLLDRVRKIRKISPPPAIQSSFEPVGNFVYKLSRREIEKLVLGIGFPAVAFATLNSYYESGMGNELAVEGSALFRKTKKEIEKMDRAGLTGLLVSVILFKKPDQLLRQGLENSGFSVYDMPPNPYVSLS